jgi:vanillate/4-hydroxybenzoate decarboxylase subunit D
MNPEKQLPCPRCHSSTTDMMTHSPVPYVWVVYLCSTCFYAWRSTEPEENTNPDKYPPNFRLTPEDLNRFLEVPEIPPKRV